MQRKTLDNVEMKYDIHFNDIACWMIYLNLCPSNDSFHIL